MPTKVGIYIFWAIRPARAIYSNIALSGRNFDFLGLYYRGILNEKVKILQGM